MTVKEWIDVLGISLATASSLGVAVFIGERARAIPSARRRFMIYMAVPLAVAALSIVRKVWL